MSEITRKDPWWLSRADPRTWRFARQRAYPVVTEARAAAREYSQQCHEDLDSDRDESCQLEHRICKGWGWRTLGFDAGPGACNAPEEELRRMLDWVAIEAASASAWAAMLVRPARASRLASARLPFHFRTLPCTDLDLDILETSEVNDLYASHQVPSTAFTHVLTRAEGHCQRLQQMLKQAVVPGCR